MHRQCHGQTYDGHDQGDYPRPPQTDANPVPGQAASGDRGGGDEACCGHVEVCDVAHDCRIEPIELLRCNAVLGLDTELKSATRERPKEVHNRVNEEYKCPAQHKAFAMT